MKTKATSTKTQQITNIEQPSELSGKRKRVIVYIPLFKKEGAAVVKEEDSSEEPPDFHQNEELKDIVIKHEDSIDEKLLLIETTPQNNTIDVNAIEPKEERLDHCHTYRRPFTANSCCIQNNIPPLKEVPSDNDYCLSCDYRAESTDAYRMHLEEVHQIPQQPRQYRSRIKPLYNITPDVNDPNYNCQSCDYRFPAKAHYRLHLKNVHKMTLEPLPKGKIGLKPRRDIIPIVDEPNNNCRSCNYQFASKQVYRRHLTMIHKMELFTSNESKPNSQLKSDVVDNFQYAIGDTFKAHLKTFRKMEVEPSKIIRRRLKPDFNISPIADDPNSYCRSCKHRFASKQMYRLHLETTHQMKLLPLPKGRIQHNTQRNMSPIIGDPLNHCRSCNYQFASKQNYKRHLQRIHKIDLPSLLKGRVKLEPQSDLFPIPNDPNNVCQTCNYQFSNKQSYRRHLTGIHKLTLEPLRNGRPKGSSQMCLLSGIDAFNYKCETCDIVFPSRTTYRHHRIQFHQMKIDLQRVRAVLKNKSHIAPVVDDPDFNCRTCNYLFSTRSAYRYHLSHLHKMNLPPLQIHRTRL